MPGGSRGVTLLELLVVVAIVAVMAGISFPALTSGLDGLRLSQACEGIAAFVNTASARADRMQRAVEIRIGAREGRLTARTLGPGFERSMTLPQGVRVANILPEEAEPGEARSFFLYPGGTVPRFGVEVASGKGLRRRVTVDPITGVARVERGQ